jgi:hypothetical protein
MVIHVDARPHSKDDRKVQEQEPVKGLT